MKHHGFFVLAQLILILHVSGETKRQLFFRGGNVGGLSAPTPTPPRRPSQPAPTPTASKPDPGLPESAMTACDSCDQQINVQIQVEDDSDVGVLIVPVITVDGDNNVINVDTTVGDTTVMQGPKGNDDEDGNMTDSNSTDVLGRK